MTAKELLSLRDGARIRVKSGSKEKIVTVRNRPTLMGFGKPGLHRVRIYVFDESRMPKNVSDELWGVMVAFDRKALYVIGGDKVVSLA